MKTARLIEKYFHLLNEQEPLVSDELIDQDTEQEAAAEEPKEERAPKPVDKRKQSLTIALALAFIFDPTRYNQDPSKKQFIESRIKTIQENTGLTIPEIIDSIGDIVCLDTNLCEKFRKYFPDIKTSINFESKTETFISRILLTLEQELDATEPQVETKQDAGETKSKQPVLQLSTGPALNLDEIFPLYRDLLVTSVEHAPESDELFMVDQAVNEFIDVDPDRVVEIIKNILRITPAVDDNDVENALSES